MSRVNVRLNEVFTIPGSVLVSVTSILVGGQNVVAGTLGVLPGRQSKRADYTGFAFFDLMTGRYQITAQSPSIAGMIYQPIIDVPNDNAVYEHTQLIVSGAAPFSQPITTAPNATVTSYGLVKVDLIELASAEGYEVTAVNYDSDGVVTTATVKWPDGSAGVFTRTLKNSTWLSVDAYTITHADSGKTVTQAAVTRDSLGRVTSKPALTISP